MATQLDFRSLLIRIQDLLSDVDRQRLHFLFGDDVPRHLRDDPSVSGAIRVLESLFDKAIINEQDCDYLIEAFKSIHCHNAAQKLQEYQRAQKTGGNDNCSLQGILLEKSEEDKFHTAGLYQPIISRTSEHISNVLHPDELNKDTIIQTQQSLPTVSSTTKKHRNVFRSISGIFRKSLTIREYALLVITILSLVSTIILWKIERKNIPKFQETSLRRPSDGICASARWLRSGITVAGGNGRGTDLKRLFSPDGLFVNEQGIIYVVDSGNHRVIRWLGGSSSGELVAGGRGKGNSSDQLNFPIDVVVDKNGTMYITDFYNHRVQQWSQEANSGQTILENLTFIGIGLDDKGSLYTSDWTYHQVRKWRKNDTVGEILQMELDSPDRLYVTENHTVYVADRANHQVMKIIGKQGFIVAGGSRGNNVDQLDLPRGVTVDKSGNVYVADTNNHRIMRWLPGATSGTLVVGGRSKGTRSHQLSTPTDLHFDGCGNLYVADSGNARVQKFLLDKNSC